MGERSQLYTITLHHSGSDGDLAWSPTGEPVRGHTHEWFADSEPEAAAILATIFAWDHQTMKNRTRRREVKDYELRVYIDLTSEKPWT